MEILILLFIVVIGTSFLCSVLESVLLSTNMSYISVLEKNNPVAGKLLKKLKIDIDKSIASILILNTIANTLGATAIGVQAQSVFEGHATFVMLISIILTFMILFFAEIIPKTIGAVHWKKLAPYAPRKIMDVCSGTSRTRISLSSQSVWLRRAMMVKGFNKILVIDARNHNIVKKKIIESVMCVMGSPKRV